MDSAIKPNETDTDSPACKDQIGQAMNIAANIWCDILYHIYKIDDACVKWGTAESAENEPETPAFEIEFDDTAENIFYFEVFAEKFMEIKYDNTHHLDVTNKNMFFDTLKNVEEFLQTFLLQNESIPKITPPLREKLSLHNKTGKNLKISSEDLVYLREEFYLSVTSCLKDIQQQKGQNHPLTRFIHTLGNLNKAVNLAISQINGDKNYPTNQVFHFH